MKKIMMILFILFSLTAQGQAHLGKSEYAIRNIYPGNKWTTGYTTKTQQKYISSDMSLGEFVYYFDLKTQLSDYCIQIPFNVTTMNGQVERYNNKYVITSETSWTAYLDEGGIMYINLVYNSDTKIRYFTYSDTK